MVKVDSQILPTFTRSVLVLPVYLEMTFDLSMSVRTTRTHLRRVLRADRGTV